MDNWYNQRNELRNEWEVLKSWEDTLPWPWCCRAKSVCTWEKSRVCLCIHWGPASESRVVTGLLALVTLGQPRRLSQATRKNQLGSFDRSWCQESDLISLGGALSAVLLSENNYEFWFSHSVWEPKSPHLLRWLLVCSLIIMLSWCGR